MNHILDVDNQPEELFELFEQIQGTNTILFLGAGASVGEKRYLSKEIIELYESKIHKKINEPNITKFLDILSADDSFRRQHFDEFVVSVLQKLEITESHKILASIPWREIITTNYDLLVERAYDEISKTSERIYDLKVIRNNKQLTYGESNTEVRYIKLNGCIKDHSEFPLAFSSDDFNKLKSFYKNVLNDLKNLSPSISLLSIGYSFTDDFGKELLDKFDSYNFREKKWITNVDPFPNESALPYYKAKRIRIVKCSFQEFFFRFKKWESEKDSRVVERKGLEISNSKNFRLPLPPKLLLNLDGIIKQLNENTKERYVKEIDFYKGDEPNFNLIRRGADIVKTASIKKIISNIEDVLKANQATIIPIFFITGDFGIGKSTFGLRLIYELEKRNDLELIAFEILDFNRLKKEYLVDLILNCKSKNIVFYCDQVEIESYFKALLDIQTELSIEQFQDCNVSFFVAIRENILEKYKLTKFIHRAHEFKIDGKFTSDEIEELLEKVKDAGLINYRDRNQKKELINKIEKEYDSDAFITLLEIITSGRHEIDLISCYRQLSPDAQKAFLYTALLHKYKLTMPANWLKQNISMDWEEFTAKVVRAEGKGILIQEIQPSHGVHPDLFFRTKHPIIATKLVDSIIQNKDEQFRFYERMLKTIEVGRSNSFLAINLLKAFIRSDEFSDTQINKLYDAAYSKLSDEPHFLLSYAINLQNRKNKTELSRAIDLLFYAESLLEFKNHRFIHRRAVINFELAKISFSQEKELIQTIMYLKEAKELFKDKQLYDPFSAYSYVDYIKMLIWEIENIEYGVDDLMQKQILAADLYDLANRTVMGDIERITKLQTIYSSYLKKISSDKKYKQYLDDLYQNAAVRHYACILLYNYYELNKETDKCKEIISEIEYYQANSEVVKFLFKYYGRNLHDVNMRVNLFKLLRENPFLEKDNPLRYSYFNFMAETYNSRFFEGKKFLESIQHRFNNLNPEFHYIWRNPDSTEQLFEALIVKNNNEKFKGVKIPIMQLTVRLIKGNYEMYKIGDEVRVKLHFYLYGLMAEIVKIKQGEV